MPDTPTQVFRFRGYPGCGGSSTYHKLKGIEHSIREEHLIHILFSDCCKFFNAKHTYAYDCEEEVSARYKKCKKCCGDKEA
jgi:hypothetical protein